MVEEHPEAVLICGAYGTGKSSVTAEMAELLEASDVPYAAIDLDWLAWANIADSHGDAGHRLMLANLAPMIGNYRAAGLTRFILAGLLTSADELETHARDARDAAARRAIDAPDRGDRAPDGLRSNVRPPVRPGALAGAGGRRRSASGLEDVSFANDRPIGDVAAEIVRWLGWG